VSKCITQWYKGELLLSSLFDVVVTVATRRCQWTAAGL